MEVKNFHILFVLLVSINIFSSFVNCDDVFGCGGFIKSHADIDFSKVEIKLLSKQGSLKDKTDCSPSNGYYFIPVYDKGEYVIRVAPPSGWSFEPEQFEINFDGKTDLCSLGKDIDFNFKGFGITGRIGIANQEIGAKGVRVDLKLEDGKPLRTTISDKNGVFEFTPVVPGKYVLKASHDRWSFAKSEYIVPVATGNTELPINSLLVSGFDVQGKILSNDQPFKNANIVLFQSKSSKDKLTSTECSGLKDASLKNSNGKFVENPSCISETSSNGNYIFSAISPGEYLIKPFFKDRKTKYHVYPEFLVILVTNDGVTVSENFEVTGFDVSGRVLTGPNGNPVPNAQIKLNGELVATTKSNGTYILQNIKPGTFTIQASANNMEFSDHTVKISPTNPSLPDIHVSAFKVCGQVISEQSHTVTITKQTTNFQLNIQTEIKSGEWCTFLANGKYSIEVFLRDEDRQSGIQFFPLTQEINVDSGHLSGIVFSQLRATVIGSVKCLTDADSTCKTISISLHSLDGNNNNRQFKTAELEDGIYIFKDVLPGNYEIRIPPSSHSLCWENKQIKLTVKSSEETVPPFVQTGYSISIISSHKTDITYKLRTDSVAQTSPTTSASLSLNSGLNQFCVVSAGTYDINFSGCHTYNSQTPNSFSTKNSNPVNINASKHRNGIRILSEEQTNYKMIVEYGDRKETVFLQPETNKVDGYHSYIYVFDLEAGDNVKFVPRSDHMLFKPETKAVTGGNDCVDVTFSFIATKGLVVIGRTDPPIENVRVTLTFPKNTDIDSLVSETSKNGEFRFGPIDSNMDIELAAEKESYIFSTFDKNTKIFKAHKLCEIVVTVKDESGRTLPGVLISLSGGESYRKNLVTGDDGIIKFHSLSPSQYYLRPMMKEYKFEPISKMIDVKDGETAYVELNGKRVAYSAYGQVTYLNGEPFGNIVVEAVSIPTQTCPEHQEESSSEGNGYYRIRGLQPACQYIVQLKQVEDNQIVDRSIPLQTTITIANNDIQNINIIGISQVTFVDVIARIVASQNDYYKTLRIQLLKKGSSESPIYSQKVESPLNPKSKINPGIMVFFPRIPLDGKSYTIETTTTLSDKNFKYILPSAQFNANTSSVYVELDFTPEVRSTENDLNQNSISALLLIALVGIVFFKQELAVEILKIVWDKLSGAIQDVVDQNRKKEETKYERVIVDDNEIEQLAQSINAIKKKKSRKTN